jgi:hypothetical protein
MESLNALLLLDDVVGEALSSEVSRSERYDFQFLGRSTDYIFAREVPCPGNGGGNSHDVGALLIGAP